MHMDHTLQPEIDRTEIAAFLPEIDRAEIAAFLLMKQRRWAEMQHGPKPDWYSDFGPLRMPR
jgi:hypothetical protein